MLTEKDKKKIEKKIDREILSAFNHAEKSKFPSKSELNKDIYAK